LFALRIFRLWRIWIFLVTIAASILATIAVYLVDDYYIASTIIIPYNTRSNESSTIFSEEEEGRIYDVFGDESHVAQLHDVALSNETIIMTMNALNLKLHWEIDTTELGYQEELREEWDKKVSVAEVESTAVEISVVDKDPQMAATVVNTHAAFADAAYQKISREENQERRKGYMRSVVALSREIDSLTLALSGLVERNPHAVFTRYSIVGARSQAEALGIRDLNNQLLSLNVDLIQNKRRLSEIQALIDSQASASYVVQPGVAPQRKYGPDRLMIILGATLGTFILMFLVAWGFTYYGGSLNTATL